MTARRSLAQDLDEWERQIHAWTWPNTARQMQAACDEVRTWAVDQSWDLDEEFELERDVQWWAFEREG